MSQEIVEAVRDIEREKGIESGTLVAALEDALLAAYKKMPGAARHAVVEIDDEGDFRVFAVELPPDIEERLIEEARERKLEELEALEVETGERSHTLISDNDLDVDWSDVPENLIKREDVTPENSCRAPSRWTASATSRARASRPSSPRFARAPRGRRSSCRVAIPS